MAQDGFGSNAEIGRLERYIRSSSDSRHRQALLLISISRCHGRRAWSSEPARRPGGPSAGRRRAWFHEPIASREEAAPPSTAGTVRWSRNDTASAKPWLEDRATAGRFNLPGEPW